MASLKFGRLEKVDIQAIWQGEADDFLAWLAEDDNLGLLGQALSFELQLEAHRTASQSHRAHLVCRDTQTNNWVIFESPSGLADHAHLGQILAHAKGYNPVNIVWMAGRLGEDHRSVLEWLNAITDDSVNFFGLEIEFWRIADSPLAPRFMLVSRPGKQVSRHRPEDQPQAARRRAARPPADPPAAAQSERPSPSGFLRAAPRPAPQRPERARPAAERKPTAPTPPAAPPGNARQGRPAPAPPPEPPASAPTGPVPSWRATQGNSSASSRLLRRFQERETSVSPSGMLRQVDPGESQGNDSGGQVRGQASDISLTQQVYLEFWTRFWEEVVQWDSDLPPQKPMLQGWVTFPIGHEDFYLIAFLSTEHNMAGMGLVMEGPEAKTTFYRLERDKEAIEREFGMQLDWRELPDRPESHIYAHRRNVDPHDRHRWGDYMAWFAEMLETFTLVLGTRLKEEEPHDFPPGDGVFLNR